MTYESHYHRQGSTLNKRRPIFKDSTKYSFLSGLAIGSICGVVVTFVIAVTR